MRATVGIFAILAFLTVSAATAETITIEASRDATLIEDPDGAWANGTGPAFFVGRNNATQNGLRRTLLYFDVAGAVPERAVIDRVRLTLYMLPSNAQPSRLALYPMLADWSEGPSSSSGGGGAPSEPGDVTWLHSFYDSEFWEYNGGQFLGRASAELVVTATSFYTWESTDDLVRDVRLWKRAPERNFGWILIGDETSRQTAKGFASREAPEPHVRPVLEITYRKTPRHRR